MSNLTWLVNRILILTQQLKTQEVRIENLLGCIGFISLEIGTNKYWKSRTKILEAIISSNKEKITSTLAKDEQIRGEG